MQAVSTHCFFSGPAPDLQKKLGKEEPQDVAKVTLQITLLYAEISSMQLQLCVHLNIFSYILFAPVPTNHQASPGQRLSFHSFAFGISSSTGMILVWRAIIFAFIMVVYAL